MDEKLDKRLKGIHRNLAIAASAMAGVMTSLARIEELNHLEALSSTAAQPAMAKATTASPSAAPAELTPAETPLSSPLLGVLTEAAHSHAGQCLECRELAAALWASFKMHAPAAAGITSTYPKPDSGPSASPVADAPSPSSELTEERLRRDFSYLNNKIDDLKQDKVGWRHFRELEQRVEAVDPTNPGQGASQ